MKYIILFSTALFLLLSCIKEPKNYLNISGTLKNNPAKVFTIQNNHYKKTIKINEDGSFRDTLHLKNREFLNSYEENLYNLSISKNIELVFLQNGFDIILNIDGSEFYYTGKGSQNNNYIKEKIDLNKSYMDGNEYFSLEREAFITKLNDIKITLDGLLTKYSNIDKDFAEAEKIRNAEFYRYLSENYERQYNQNTKKGSPSPEFINYENYKGGTSSLADFRGKYVYLDVWATWCAPCIAQIPYLQNLEKKYHNKKIQFVSISIDKPNLKNIWEKMIKENNMGGIQLFANDDKKFSNAYKIYGIPRFILIDPKGNIVDANAPRPSDPKLIELFDKLDI